MRLDCVNIRMQQQCMHQAVMGQVWGNPTASMHVLSQAGGPDRCICMEVADCEEQNEVSWRMQYV